MIRLYSYPRTRALRPRWLLEEMRVPYEIVPVDIENPDPEYFKVHPLGRVPALSDGDLTLIESAAICMYLADKFTDKGFAPPLGSADRALYYQWILFAMATLEPPVENRLQEEFNEAAKVLENAIRGREFLVGDRLTAADVVIGAVLIWARSVQMLKEFPELERYARSLRHRGAFNKAIS